MASERHRDVAQLRRMLARSPAAARKARFIVEAARAARIDALELLHGRGADLDASWRGYRPLHALIQEHPHAEGEAPPAERLRCLDWLLAHGADPEQLGAWPPARAVIVAAFTGIAVYVERLLEAGARRDLFVACALGDTRAVARELKRDDAAVSSRDAGGLTALQCCAGSRLGKTAPRVQARLLEVATALLDAGADPGARTKSWSHEVEASYLAVSAGNAALVDLLLARRADPNRALVSAAWRDDDAFAEICLRHGADPNRAAEGDRPLLNEMIRWGRIERALWLLDKGADPNLADARGWTALHQAASRGNERIFRALLDTGGRLDREDRAGKTPLELAKPKARAKLARISPPTAP